MDVTIAAAARLAAMVRGAEIDAFRAGRVQFGNHPFAPGPGIQAGNRLIEGPSASPDTADHLTTCFAVPESI